MKKLKFCLSLTAFLLVVLVAYYFIGTIDISESELGPSPFFIENFNAKPVNEPLNAKLAEIANGINWVLEPGKPGLHEPDCKYSDDDVIADLKLLTILNNNNESFLQSLNEIDFKEFEYEEPSNYSDLSPINHLRDFVNYLEILIFYYVRTGEYENALKTLHRFRELLDAMKYKHKNSIEALVYGVIYQLFIFINLRIMSVEIPLDEKMKIIQNYRPIEIDQTYFRKRIFYGEELIVHETLVSLRNNRFKGDSFTTNFLQKFSKFSVHPNLSLYFYRMANEEINQNILNGLPASNPTDRFHLLLKKKNNSYFFMPNHYGLQLIFEFNYANRIDGNVSRLHKIKWYEQMLSIIGDLIDFRKEKGRLPNALEEVYPDWGIINSSNAAFKKSLEYSAEGALVCIIFNKEDLKLEDYLSLKKYEKIIINHYEKAIDLEFLK